MSPKLERCVGGQIATQTSVFPGKLYTRTAQTNGPWTNSPGPMVGSSSKMIPAPLLTDDSPHDYDLPLPTISMNDSLPLSCNSVIGSMWDGGWLYIGVDKIKEQAGAVLCQAEVS